MGADDITKQDTIVPVTEKSPSPIRNDVDSGIERVRPADAPTSHVCRSWMVWRTSTSWTARERAFLSAATTRATQTPAGVIRQLNDWRLRPFRAHGRGCMVSYASGHFMNHSGK